MTCYLIRHGKDDDTIRGGWSNAPLTVEGVKQAEGLAAEFAANHSLIIKQIFTSDLPRARQTADVLATQLDLPVTELPEFRETNNGLLAGMQNALANELYPGLYWNTLGWDEHYPDGESPHEFYDRIRCAWHHFKEQIANAGTDVALVTHAGVINTIACIEHGIPYTNKAVAFPVGNARWVAVEI